MKPAARLFFTCWLIYSLHVATNTVREIYLSLSLGDHLSFRVDEYAGLHPDLFELPDRGWHINSNPGASIIGAIPYALLRPLTDRIVTRVNQQRAASGQQPPEYGSPWPMAREFFKNSWQRGYDIKFGLAAIITQTLAMAPLTALNVVAMYLLLARLLEQQSKALWLALLYAFGTPIFFRTGVLNQNQLVADAAMFGLAALWSSPDRRRCLWAGVAGGAAVLMDYTGVVILAGLAIWMAASSRSLRGIPFYALGALGPILLLAFYQWQSFGNPFLPAQHWMPAVAWVEQGYRGISLPQADMLLANAFDLRYGLFSSCPLLLAAFLAPLSNAKYRMHTLGLIAIAAALWLFASSVHYSRLQFNSGVRYMVPAIPFLFLPVALVLSKWPARAACSIGMLSVAQAWALAMYRDVERGYGVIEPLLHVFLGGFQLPLLTVLSRMKGSFGQYFEQGVSPLPLFVLAGLLLYGIWSSRFQKQ
jgi:hypothetical protein